MKDTWHESNTGNHQGLIISEITGDNIAVSYDKKHARLIAAAPDLLEACEATLLDLEDMTSEEFSKGADRHSRIRLNVAIAKAKGES